MSCCMIGKGSSVVYLYGLLAVSYVTRVPRVLSCTLDELCTHGSLCQTNLTLYVVRRCYSLHSKSFLESSLQISRFQYIISILTGTWLLLYFRLFLRRESSKPTYPSYALPSAGISTYNAKRWNQYHFKL